ncbi:MAG: ribonuclease P protein component 4 [Minisyncoccales bacterium]
MTSKKHKIKNNRSKKKSFQIIAEKRINELFERANEFLEINTKYSDNCVKLARKISLRYKVPLTKQQKMLFCKKCGAYLHPNITSRVRVSRGKIVILCLKCKNISRYMYK